MQRKQKQILNKQINKLKNETKQSKTNKKPKNPKSERKQTNISKTSHVPKESIRSIDDF